MFSQPNIRKRIMRLIKLHSRVGMCDIGTNKLNVSCGFKVN